MQAWPGSDTWDGGYIASLDFRTVPGSQPGSGTAWIRTDTALAVSYTHLDVYKRQPLLRGDHEQGHRLARRPRPLPRRHPAVAGRARTPRPGDDRALG